LKPLALYLSSYLVLFIASSSASKRRGTASSFYVWTQQRFPNSFIAAALIMFLPTAMFV
jgi:hypothetical protein